MIHIPRYLSHKGLSCTAQLFEIYPAISSASMLSQKENKDKCNK